MEIYLSIIIPVYNVEKYLNQCVDSVIAQHLNNAEIILVDDGSPDSCPQICDEYAQKYSNIHVIHKKNGGLSSARNAGIRKALGKYLIFMDSDDFWNKDVNVNSIINRVKEKELEMYLFGCLDFIDGEVFKRNEHNNLMNIKTDSIPHYYEGLLLNGNLEVHASTKIIKKDFLVKNSLYFTEGLLSEDNDWMLRLLRCLHSVDIITEPLYMYRANRQGSITHTIKKKNIVDLLTIVQNSIDYYKNNPDSELKRLELCYGSYLWFSALGLSARLNSDDKHEVKHLFKKTEEVCQYSTSKKTKLSNTVYKIFGYNITCWILGSYIQYKNNLNKKQVA